MMVCLAGERRVMVETVIDHGTVVQLLGRYADGSRAAIACDHRPFQRFWADWAAAGFPQPLFHDPARNALRFD